MSVDGCVSLGVSVGSICVWVGVSVCVCVHTRMCVAKYECGRGGCECVGVCMCANMCGYV